MVSDLPQMLIKLLAIAKYEFVVDRAFVHMDYAEYNLPGHLQQDS